MPATDFSMTLHLKPTTISEDVSIHHAQGRIFARIWTPSTDKRQSPIVLFHDSVGCVELWRGFPAALSAGTERRVIAYDRRSTKGQKEILNESLLFHEGLHGYSGKEDGDLENKFSVSDPSLNNTYYIRHKVFGGNLRYQNDAPNTPGAPKCPTN
jgi:hypothetical protein